VAEHEVYHIVSREDWQQAQVADAYVSPSLAAEGFVHCSTRAQLIETANQFYAGEDGLVLLCIASALLQPELRWEAPTRDGQPEPRGGLFPHIYGPVNLAAVTRVLDFPAGANGRFVLPEALAAAQGPLVQAQEMSEETAQKLIGFLERSAPVRRLRASHVVSGLLGAVGFALFVVGVEKAAEDLPLVSNPYGSIGAGIVLLLATGLLLRKLAGGE
jgi:uncharacterized protein (DUF952 family)